MAAGPKDQLVTIQREVRAADGYAGVTRSIQQVGQLWAAVRPQRATEAERQGSVREMTVYLLTCNAMAVRALALDHTMRAVWSGRTMNIREVRLGSPRDADCDVVAEFGVAQ